MSVKCGDSDPGNVLFLSSVDLFMPKFSISSQAALDNTLRELGITNAFGNNADFSGISEEIKLKVSKVGEANIPSCVFVCLFHHTYTGRS